MEEEANKEVEKENKRTGRAERNEVRLTKRNETRVKLEGGCQFAKIIGKRILKGHKIEDENIPEEKQRIDIQLSYFYEQKDK